MYESLGHIGTIFYKIKKRQLDIVGIKKKHTKVLD
jgi:hypothetical protein